MTFSAQAVLDAMTTVVSGSAPLHVPEIAGNEWTYVKECLDTGWVSSVGSYVDNFGDMLTAATGAKYVVPTINGTAALHVCLMLAGVEPGDEVIVPALSFAATANAVFYCHAVPHFADSEEATMGLDPGKLEAHLLRIAKSKGGDLLNAQTGRRISALVCMHTFGHPVDLDGVAKVCDRFGLPLIEDAAESLGSIYKGRHTGNHGVLSALSFNGNKIVTTGVGGAIITKNSSYAKLSRHLTTTSKIKHKWEFIHDRVGYNYRISNLNASLGISQIAKLNKYISHKRKLFKKFSDLIKDEKQIKILNQPKNCRSNFWLQTLVLDKPSKLRKTKLLNKFHNKNIFARPVWRPLHKLKYLKKYPRMNLKNAEKLENQIINIPSSYYL